jgi:hypothetical protein
MVNFRANFINTASIVKYGHDNKPQVGNASFVELNPLDKNDYLTLNKVNLNWENCNTYANDITEKFNKAYIAGDDRSKRKFYALTSQEDKFERLREDDVLGLALVEAYMGGISFFVDYLQVSPNHKHTVGGKHIKHIGTAILNSLKEIVPKKNIFLDAVNSEVGFYERNGFKVESKGKSETVMRWVGKTLEKISSR